MSEQLKKFKLKWVKYEGWDWVGDDPCDQFENEFEFVRAQDADALAERLREAEAALQVFANDHCFVATEYFEKWGEK